MILTCIQAKKYEGSEGKSAGICWWLFTVAVCSSDSDALIHRVLNLCGLHYFQQALTPSLA